MKIKKIYKFLLLIASLIFFISSIVSANETNLEDTYKEQFQAIGGSELKESLPKETAKKLEKFGITGENWEEFSNLNFSDVFDEILNVGKEKSANIISIFGKILAIILICAIFENLKPKNSISEILSVVGILCLCICMVDPVLKSIWNIALIIKSSAGFILCFVPVMTGIMIAAGKPITASSYNLLMLSTGQIVAQIAGNFIVPLINTVFGISIISGISTKLNISGVCSMFHKIAKWVLGFITTAFVGILSIQTAITSSADSATSESVKFAIGSFVPIVGSAISDAVGTVHGCVKLLKSGMGAFGIIATGAIFLPILIECLIWILSLWSLSIIGETFQLTKISKALKGTADVMSTLLAVIVSSSLIMIVSMVVAVLMF